MFLLPANKVWGKVIFSEVCVKNSVHRWGWYPSMHCRWYPSMPCRYQGRSPGPHPGGKLRGLARGGLHGPHPGGGLPQCMLGYTTPTPRGWLLPRAVHILLECILVMCHLNTSGRGRVSSSRTRFWTHPIVKLDVSTPKYLLFSSRFFMHIDLSSI